MTGERGPAGFEIHVECVGKPIRLPDGTVLELRLKEAEMRKALRRKSSSSPFPSGYCSRCFNWSRKNSASRSFFSMLRSSIASLTQGCIRAFRTLACGGTRTRSPGRLAGP
jgi:hypothetical protein